MLRWERDKSQGTNMVGEKSRNVDLAADMASDKLQPANVARDKG